LRRLFSTFAPGAPGVGLLLLRVVAGVALIAPAIARLRAEAPAPPLIPVILGTGSGTLLIAGLWTPVSGAMVALIEIWSALSQPGDPWTNVLLGAIGGALALLGPGAWSVDAKLFGWKRVNFHS